MNSKWISSVFLVAALSLFFADAQAQAKKKSVPTKKTSSKQSPKPKAEAVNTQVVDAGFNVPVKDTVKPVVAVKDPFAFDSLRISLRPDAAIDRNLVKSRTPLAYEHIREDDAWYRERVWREIDIREKMNLAFRYKAEDDNGNQRFINILLRAVRKGDVTAFDPNVDDRFTTPMTVARVGEVISGKCDSVQVLDWAKDPSGSKGIYKVLLV